MSKPASSIQKIFTVPYDFCTKSKPRIAISVVIEAAILAIGILALIQVMPEIGLFGAIPTAVGGALLVLTIALTIYRSCKDEKLPSPVPDPILNQEEKPSDIIKIKEVDTEPNPKAAQVSADIVVRAAYASPQPPPAGWTEDDVLLLRARLLEKLNLSDVEELLARHKEIYGLFNKLMCHLMSESGEYDIEYAADTLYLLYCEDKEMFRLRVNEETKVVIKLDGSQYDARQKMALYYRVQYEGMRKTEKWKEDLTGESVVEDTMGQILRANDSQRVHALLFSKLS